MSYIQKFRTQNCSELEHKPCDLAVLREVRGRDELSPNSEHKNAQNSEHKLSDLAVLREVRGRGELFRTPNAKVRFSSIFPMSNICTDDLSSIIHMARKGITQL